MSLASGLMIPVGEGQIFKLNFPALTATGVFMPLARHHFTGKMRNGGLEAGEYTVEWKVLDPSCFSLNQFAWALLVPLFSCSLLWANLHAFQTYQ